MARKICLVNLQSPFFAEYAGRQGYGRGFGCSIWLQSMHLLIQLRPRGLHGFKHIPATSTYDSATLASLISSDLTSQPPMSGFPQEAFKSWVMQYEAPDILSLGFVLKTSSVLCASWTGIWISLLGVDAENRLVLVCSRTNGPCKRLCAAFSSTPLVSLLRDT